MDGDRFDRLTRSLTSGASRRRLIGTVTRGLLAAVPIALGLRQAAAAGLGGASCSKDSDCQSNQCLRSGVCSCSNQVPCIQLPNPCKKLVCALTRCQRQNQDDGTKCPNDGNPCTDNVCKNGQCTHPDKPDGTSCPPDGNPCKDSICKNGQCTHPNKPNGSNCPGDNNPCTENVCKDGQCIHPNKPNGVDCPSDGNPCTDSLCKDGKCTHPNLPNGSNCPSDGNPCTDNVCKDGQCLHPKKPDDTGCPAGLCCDGACLDTKTDPDNCGGCGHKCIAGVRCVDAECQGNCDPRDPNVEQCPDGTCCHLNQCQFCRNGTCFSECQAGQSCVNKECTCNQQGCRKGCCKGDQCVLFHDQRPNTCGTGGETCFACPGVQQCCGGSCCRIPGGPGGGPVCCIPRGAGPEDGTCADLSSDPNNCGDCSHKCTADQRCVGGQCVCDGKSCPNGCCDAQGRCQPGNTDQVCGRGGGPCATCGSGNHCVARQCVCDAQSCTGNHCCENDPGSPGRCFNTDSVYCGVGGEKCQICEGLDQCGNCGDPPRVQCC